MKMDRRDFLASMGIGGITAALGTGPAGLPLSSQARAADVPLSLDPAAQLESPRNIRLNIRPVMTNIIHSDSWEGPCRWKAAGPAEEKANAERTFHNWVSNITSGKINTGTANLLKPVHITFSEDFHIPETELAKLRTDIDNTDAFFIAPWGSSVASFDLASTFNKPILMVGLGCRQVDITAYTRSKGFEAYACTDYDRLNETIGSLRARKVFRQTRVLFPTDRGLPAVASITSVNDLDDLAGRVGVAIESISYKALADEMKRVTADRAERQKAQALADKLISDAEQTLLDRKYVVSSVQFYQAATNLMHTHNCNAFTIECFEFCSSRLPEQWKITPCLVHTLLKDRGFASSCEADLGALLAMRMLMSLSQKSSHMGNADLASDGDFSINHSVPGLKMNGYDKPPLAYKLGHFTESGWGAKFVVDFIENNESAVTVARVNPAATKVLVLRGRLVGSAGWEQDIIGCSVKAFIRPPKGRSEEFLEKRIDYGNHLPWVYGDYTKQMKLLGQMLGLTVEAIS